MADTTFTPDQITKQAQLNAGVIPLVALAFLKERGISLDQFATFVGERFAPGWSTLQGGAAAVARMAALNIVSGGADLVGPEGDENRAEATLAGWDGQQTLDMLGLTQAEADTFVDAFGPIAASLGLRYAARRAGDQLHLSFTR